MRKYIPQHGNTGHSLVERPSNQAGRLGSSMPSNSKSQRRITTFSVGALPQLFTDIAIRVMPRATISSITIRPQVLSSLSVTHKGVSTSRTRLRFITIRSIRPGALPQPPGSRFMAASERVRCDVICSHLPGP
ncbi:hypothetical protein [uncultured Prevotella sp.]|uniref:hypothetical protein n=1 Tax=uncultured Prevotella sp. TaxID=159272 RepID=UPI0025E64306|nr:hypothetical protein [uncultured Prevotella sp.]